ncbi:MAG: YkgJ family cysteine cluster protein [Deltaproteobacteria bacterium]
MQDAASEKEVFEPLDGDRFRFLCHRGMECFTLCCAGLNLVLMPYDILRMKHRLDISSGEFLNRYTEMRFDRHPRFPMVVLKMKDEEGRRCPFVQPEGCAAYEDRPSACRIYPIGRAAMNPGGESSPLEKYFVVREEHCLGFREPRDWTIEDWVADQGLKEYDTMNSAWLDIVTSSQSLGQEKDIPRKIQMFCMASYNLDSFRSFVFKSKFLDVFDVSPELRDRLASDDEALLAFAMDWLKFSLYGMKTMRLR